MIQTIDILPLWCQPAPEATVRPKLQYRGRNESYLEETTEETARQIVIHTLLQIDDNGYCAWKLESRDGLVIIICRDPQDGRIPPGYPCFTIEEMSNEDLELTHLVCYAKLHGAVVESVELVQENLPEGDSYEAANAGCPG